MIHPQRKWRDANDITLTALADLMGVTPSHLSEIERWRGFPSLPLASKLSQHTGIPLTEYVGPLPTVAKPQASAAE